MEWYGVFGIQQKYSRYQIILYEKKEKNIWMLNGSGYLWNFECNLRIVSFETAMI